MNEGERAGLEMLRCSRIELTPEQYKEFTDEARWLEGEDIHIAVAKLSGILLRFALENASK